MAKLPTLRREIALVLVSAQSDPSVSKRTCTLSDELARVFVHNNATDALTSDVATMCNEAGLLILRRALSKYKASDKYKAVELSADELFAQLDRLKGEANQENAQEKAEEFTEDFEADERDRLRSYLRDTYGLNSAEDWEHLKQSRHCIAQKNPDLFGQLGRKTARRLSKLAFSLYETAKANGCSPVEWVRWKKDKALVKAGKVNPGAIINVPGGGQIWGDGEPVRKDKDGKPRRRSIDIFGNEVASNEQPNIDDIDDMMGRAYKSRQK